MRGSLGSPRPRRFGVQPQQHLASSLRLCEQACLGRDIGHGPCNILGGSLCRLASGKVLPASSCADAATCSWAASACENRDDTVSRQISLVEIDASIPALGGARSRCVGRLRLRVRRPASEFGDQPQSEGCRHMAPKSSTREELGWVFASSWEAL